MSLIAPNITVANDYDNDSKNVTIERSPLPYNDRRRFGSRLKRLHAHLGTLKPSQYNHDSLVDALNPKAPACGSIACAFGHAVISEKFKGLHTTVTLKPNAVIDSKGRVSDDDLKFKVIDQPGLKRYLKAAGLKVCENSDLDDFSTAADAYFGPGAWNAIFDTEAYPWSGKGAATKAVVRKRIKDMAEKAYGVKVAA